MILQIIYLKSIGTISGFMETLDMYCSQARPSQFWIGPLLAPTGALYTMKHHNTLVCRTVGVWTLEPDFCYFYSALQCATQCNPCNCRNVPVEIDGTEWHSLREKYFQNTLNLSSVLNVSTQSERLQWTLHMSLWACQWSDETVDDFHLISKILHHLWKRID